LVISAYNLEEELKEAFFDLKEYFNDNWNVIEILSYCMSISYISLDLYCIATKNENIKLYYAL